MINSAKQNAKRSKLFSYVQNDYKNAHEVPNGVILLESLKTLEVDLQKRSFLSSVKEQIHPLWFLAETERNIFLWRSGFSLEDVHQFEFWVDLNALIDKRLQQIENFDSENPFFNSLWGFTSNNPENLNAECDYLKALREVLHSIINHASALSAVTSLISKELFREEEKAIIILPQRAKEKRP